MRGLPLLTGLGVFAAIAVTTTMDATGLSMFSALPLLVLAGSFWFLERLPRREVGLTPGRAGPYLLTLLHPALVLGTLAAMAFAAGAVDTSETDWNVTVRNVLIMSTTGVLGTLLTEEGFFRGWLWASLSRRGAGRDATLAVTTAVFAVWHLSAIVLPTEFAPAREQAPVLFGNVVLLGLIWGVLRRMSGSVLVPSLGHAVWNGCNYVLFGLGEKVGDLGIADTGRYGPENGHLGLLLNGVFAGVLLWFDRERRDPAGAGSLAHEEVSDDQ